MKSKVPWKIVCQASHRNTTFRAFWENAAISHILPTFNPVILNFDLFHCCNSFVKIESFGLDNCLNPLKTV